MVKMVLLTTLVEVRFKIPGQVQGGHMVTEVLVEVVAEAMLVVVVVVVILVVEVHTTILLLVEVEVLTILVPTKLVRLVSNQVTVNLPLLG